MGLGSGLAAAGARPDRSRGTELSGIGADSEPAETPWKGYHIR